MRLFLAIDPGAACRQRLAGVIAAVRATTSGGIRWVRDTDLHLTIAFLGEVADAERAASVDRAMREVAARHRPFSSQVLGRGGVFPDWRRARVVWLAVEEDGALAELGAAVGSACAACGFPPDRAFRAHVTIGRISRPLRPLDRATLQDALGRLSESHPFDVERVQLLRSDVGAAGSRYTEVASYPLAGP